MLRLDSYALSQSLIYRVSLVLFCAVTVAACSDGSDSHSSNGGQEPTPRYSALIERTEYGTAHITAEDWGSLGFGQAYAFAQDRFCVLADQIVKVRSERSLYFGEGEDRAHVESDLAFLALGVMERAPALLDSLSEETRETLNGYVAGFNQYLVDTGGSNIPGGCAGSNWLKPIDANSLMAYYLNISIINSSRRWLSGVANARPPGADSLAATSTDMQIRVPAVASNVFAFGKDLTSTGRGMLLSNTHLAWEGEFQYHEAHLTIPGLIDVAGVSLTGFFGIVNGFNNSVAWGHTFSTSFQYLIYSLDLVPGIPTRYYYGAEERDMEARTYSLEVLQPDDSTKFEEHTLYYSQYGPMLIPGLGLNWTDEKAFTLFDPNLDNSAFIDMMLSLDRSGSITELRESIEKVGSAPFNIIATDSTGETFYADVTPVPKLSESAEATYLTMLKSNEANEAKRFFSFPFGLGFVLLDGSDPEYGVVYDQNTTVPGTIPFVEAPQLNRRDFVGNSNDTYWLANPYEPLFGYSIRYGEVETPRKLRTRMGLRQIIESSNWSRIELEQMLFANRSFTEELWRDSLVDYCSRFTEVTASSGEVVNIEAACGVLSNWDSYHNLDSIGAILYREITSNVDIHGNLARVSYFSESFDVERPIDTPSGLTDEGLSYLSTQLADAVLRLGEAGIPIDATLREYQYTLRGDERVPIHGGQSRNDGAFNVVNYTLADNSTLLPRMPTGEIKNPRTNLTDQGYPINSGATYIMATEFTNDGPITEAILTYSQSNDPESPNYSDQTALYSSKTWRLLPFTREQIETDSLLNSMRVTN